MSFAMTYTSLAQSIQDYAERTDTTFVDHIPEFVAMAENRIAQEIHNLGYRRIVTGNLIIGDSNVAKPARWRETISFSITDPVTNDKIPLFYRSFEYLQMYWPNVADVEVPRFYSDSDYDHWLISPTPDAAYEIQVVYHERPTPLDDINQTNWTTKYAPNLLLAACLLEAQPFLMRPDRQQVWEQMYQTAASAILKEGLTRLGGDQTNMRSEG